MTARAFFGPEPAPHRDDALFDELRKTEYARLDADNQAYLDFTGSALYADRQITAHAGRLRRVVLGNPHSQNCPSLVSTAMIREAKASVLAFLDASPSDYVVCFTANTSAAIKLVAESFPFGEANGLALTADNHNSMNGIREFARGKGAAVSYIGLDDDLRLVSPRKVLRSLPSGSLFGFPAQSNFSGVKHPLSLIDVAHRCGHMVLLDAAAFLPANKLSLKRHPADFVALSVYKIAGYPTGVGALVARRESLARLTRPWFAGGTVDYVSVQHGTHRLSSDDAGAFEDGTPAFVDIAAVADGFSFLEGIGMDRINRHVMRHTNELISGLKKLARRGGGPLVRIHGPGVAYDRGATVAFNIVGRTGDVIPFAHVVERARNEGVSFRGGCFCNPGASEAAFKFSPDATGRCFRSLADQDFTVEKFSECLGPGAPVGAVRASMGIATNSCDIDRALAVVASFR
jgi:selenocysteine lyase/cysteine desulfurase